MSIEVRNTIRGLCDRYGIRLNFKDHGDAVSYSRIDELNIYPDETLESVEKQLQEIIDKHGELLLLKKEIESSKKSQLEKE